MYLIKSLESSILYREKSLLRSQWENKMSSLESKDNFWVICSEQKIANVFLNEFLKENKLKLTL